MWKATLELSPVYSWTDEKYRCWPCISIYVLIIKLDLVFHTDCFLILDLFIKYHTVPIIIRSNGMAPGSSSTVIIKINNNIPKKIVRRESILPHFSFKLILFLIVILIESSHVN
jgi:hypothetical protein|tara:strand:+ start:4088 stop:4429 length:342 start_codon:yes stop_codon:yes gene_type:complete